MTWMGADRSVMKPKKTVRLRRQHDLLHGVQLEPSRAGRADRCLLPECSAAYH